MEAIIHKGINHASNHIHSDGETKKRADVVKKANAFFKKTLYSEHQVWFKPHN